MKLPIVSRAALDRALYQLALSERIRTTLKRERDQARADRDELGGSLRECTASAKKLGADLLATIRELDAAMGRLAAFERDRLPDRDDVTGRFAKREKPVHPREG